VRFFGIIPYEVVHQAAVKNIGVIQTIGIPIYKLLLTGSVESLNMSVRPRVPEIIKKVDEIVIKTRLSEVLQKFAAVIGLNTPDRKWRDTGKFV